MIISSHLIPGTFEAETQYFGWCGGWWAQVAYFGAMLKLYLEGKPVFNCIDNDLGY